MVIWYDGFNFTTPIPEEYCGNRRNKYFRIGAGFDCETSQFEDHSKYDKGTYEYNRALHSAVYIWQFSIGEDDYLCRSYALFSKFLADLHNACNAVNPKAKLLILDANIKYEYSYFFPLIKSNITNIFAKSKTDIVNFDVYNNLHFQECLGACGSSLADCAKKHTKTQKMKGDIDYNLIRTFATPLTDKELQYCINDTRILVELCEYLFTEYLDNGKQIPLTLTSIVRNEVKSAMNCARFKKKYEDENLKLIGSQTEYNLFRNYLYSGGLTHSNFKYVGKKLDNVHCYDLTSAYPWALNAKYYPAGELVKCDLMNVNDLNNAMKARHKIMRIRFTNIQSKSTHSTISIHKTLSMLNPVIDNGRIFLAEAIEVMCSEVDLQNIKMIYTFEKLNVLEMWYFTKSARANKDMLAVMNDWYKRKTILKPLTSHEHQNDADYAENVKEYKRLKSLINSVYGMTVTRLYDTEIIYENEELQEVNNSWSDYNKTVFNPYVGYWCTAYVRQRLIQCISKYPDYIVQYDTDSIYCLPCEELDKYVQEINAEIGREMFTRTNISECLDLGQWDNDGDYTNGFICLGSKRYVGKYADGNYKITFAGASDTDIIREAQRLGMDIFDYVINFDITEELSTKTGAYHFNDTFTTEVTDYLGNTETVTTYGGTTVKTVQFNATLSHNFKILQDLYA